MSTDYEFDVFLAHHSGDKPLVRQIGNKLKQRGLKPWIDEEQIAPGRSFQDEIQQAIPIVKTAAIILGKDGLGRWQQLEIKTFFTQCVNKGTPVIPVLLPGVDEVPENLPFLREFRWINFEIPEDTTALGLLIWGITGKRPEEELKDRSSSATSTKTIQPSSFDDDICYNQEKAQYELKNYESPQKEPMSSPPSTTGTETIQRRKFLISATKLLPVILASLVLIFAGQLILNRIQSVFLIRDLESALRDKQLKDADDITTDALLLEIGRNDLMGKRREDIKLSEGEIQKIPCEILKEVNELWEKNSGKRFGFRKQSGIWKELEQQQPDKWAAFADRVGWRENNAWVSSPEFTLQEEEGHLPSFILGEHRGFDWETFFQRTQNCGIY